MDRLRRALGRAAEGLLQRADRPEPEDAVDAADHVVRGLARSELRDPDRRSVRHRVDGLLLLRGREGLAGAHATPHQPAPAPRRRRHVARPRDLRGRTGDLDARRAAADRPPTVVGPDHLRLGEDVRQATRPVPRAGRAPHPDRGRHDVRAMAADRGDRPARNRVGRGAGRLGVPLGGRRHDVRAARARSRAWPRRRARSSRSTRIVRSVRVERLSARAPPVPAAPRSDRALRPRLGRADEHGRSSSRSRSGWRSAGALVAPVVELEDHRPFPSLRRSAELVRGRWIRVGSLVGVSAALALFAGPLLGAILIFTYGRAARRSQHRRGRRLRARDAVRRARHRRTSTSTRELASSSSPSSASPSFRPRFSSRQPG